MRASAAPLIQAWSAAVEVSAISTRKPSRSVRRSARTMGALRAIGVPSSARRSHDFMASPTLPGETVSERPAR